MLRTLGALYILTWKRASHHNGVHFFIISPGPNLVCVVRFDLEMCFAPQRRALFIISTSKSGPNLVCFVHFDLGMCFAPQRRAIFHLSSGQLAAPAALASLLFHPPEPQIIGKHSESRRFYLFGHLHLLSSDSFSSLIFSLLLFSSLTLPTSALASVHIVGSLTSKLPSIILSYCVRYIPHQMPLDAHLEMLFPYTIWLVRNMGDP